MLVRSIVTGVAATACVVALALANDREAATSPLTSLRLPEGLPEGSAVGLARLTFEKGESFAADYAGPVVFYVDDGTVAIEPSVVETNSLTWNGPAVTPPRLRNNSEGWTLLTEGYAVVAEDGKLGEVRNGGPHDAVVLALSVSLDTWTANDGAQEVPAQPDETP
jgi:hypothetical protein